MSSDRLREQYDPVAMTDLLEKGGYTLVGWRAEKRIHPDIQVGVDYQKLPLNIQQKFFEGEWMAIPPDISERRPEVQPEVILIQSWVLQAKEGKKKAAPEQKKQETRPEQKKQETPAPKNEPECSLVPSVVQQGQAIQPSPTSVSLTAEIVRKYFCKNATDEEAFMFIQLCACRNLNPFTHEVYMIKYGQSASMVVGIEAFQKRAEQHKQYDGLKNGVIITTQTGELVYRAGTLCLPGEKLVGGWAEVYRKDRKEPTRIEVSLEEYIQIKDGRPTRFWEKMPGTMIAKVARSQALRQAFTTEMGGMYAEEELGDKVIQ